MIQVSEVHKSYPDGASRKSVLTGVSFSVAKGQSLALTGESGSGKSTLLHLLAGLDSADEGSISVDEKDISQLSETQSDMYRRSTLGIVFQQFNLIDCLSGWDNVSLPARLVKNYQPEYLRALLKDLGIDKIKDNLPVDMSGGEQQRFAIARALAHQPKVLLADEPTGNLDDTTSARVSNLMFGLCEKYQTTLVVVTHSQVLASQSAFHLHLVDGQLVSKP